MELLYLLIEDCTRLGRHKEISFSGKYSFLLSKYSEEKKELELQIKPLTSFPSNFFSPNIANVTAILGENGTGKTSFLEFLRRFFTQNINYVEQFLAVFIDGNALKVFHTLYDFIVPIEDGELKFYKNEWSVKVMQDENFVPTVCLHPHGIDRYSPIISRIGKLESTRLIYYSGIFDLKDYPYSDSPSYIDLSTNFLIEKDSNPDKFSLPEKEILLRHKHKNILRQFKLIISGLLDRIEFSVPDSINIVFENVSLNIDDSRDISSNDKEIFKFFLERLSHKEYPEVLKIISDNQDTENEALKIAQKRKCKLRFIDSLLWNFFKNIDNGEFFDRETKVTIDSLKNLDVFDAIKSFFYSQKLIDNRFVVGLIECAYSIIDEHENNTIDSTWSTMVNVKDFTSVVGLLSNYEWYLDSFHSHSKYGFIEVEWRDMSSGEKAFLDLFSRLYYAKDQLVKNFKEALEEHRRAMPIQTVYVLLDEAEIGFHPEWQRKYLNNLDKFLSYLFYDAKREVFQNAKVQLVIASHSPFLASDLPKSNIVFLKRDMDSLLSVYSFSREQTFGANIHTLYSDSFFLQNGLIGEFAKNKINEVIMLINNTNQLNEFIREKILDLIGIIGEPIIKAKLETMYMQKFGIEEEVRMLRKRLRDLGAD